ncbi:unnamed protein product [Allacma fusca]|uniref:Uncharacterized protein n=1 Tax=Allacma fusca TaxID=39272 RepID=A0A8J2JMC3_9HEXA|nr:unnamed protein product [Allacma fusca]
MTADELQTRAREETPRVSNQSDGLTKDEKTDSGHRGKTFWKLPNTVRITTESNPTPDVYVVPLPTEASFREPLPMEDINLKGFIPFTVHLKILLSYFPALVLLKKERRGSHLLAAAGIDYERRRKHSFQNADSRIYQEGNDFLMEEKDGKVTKLEIIEVTEKMGNLRKAVPTLPLCIAILLCFVNTFLPGVGTLIGAASLLCCGKCRHEHAFTGIKYGVIAGLIQMLLAFLVVGWIYSIIYGVQMIQDAITRSAISPETPSSEEEKPPTDSKQSQAWA